MTKVEASPVIKVRETDVVFRKTRTTLKEKETFYEGRKIMIFDDYF
jgi:hypothetical protein